jgi:hypothetical protein
LFPNTLSLISVPQVQVSNFFKEVPAIIKRMWLMLITCTCVIAAIAVMATSLVPVGYRITAFNAIWPLAMTVGSHVLMPIVLNREFYGMDNDAEVDPDVRTS